MMENGFDNQHIQREMLDQVVRDFRWMPELVTALHNYIASRSQYLTLNDFYPEIERTLNEYLRKEQNGSSSHCNKWKYAKKRKPQH